MGLLPLLLSINVSATDLVIDFVDSIEVADTAIASIRADTAYSSIIPIWGFNRIQFFAQLGLLEGYHDTNFAADTFFVDFQHSFDRVNWNLWLCDTFQTNDTDWVVLNVSTADSVVGKWGRARFIHWDSLEATGPGILANTYGKRLYLWMNGTQ